LTAHGSARNVNFMRRLMFAMMVLPACAALGRAQDVPGRDLLDFPLGTLAEAPTLATHSADGFWNPAAAVLAPNVRARAGAAALAPPADQGGAMQLLAIAARVPGSVTVGLSIVRASVSDLIRTEFDPRSVGGEIPYGTTVLSAIAGRRHENIAGALALRYRMGEEDMVRRAILGVDGGVIAERLFGTELRAAASTFLWSPANTNESRARFGVALDTRLFGVDSLREARGGYAAAVSTGVQEHYVFTSGRVDVWELRGGVVGRRAYGHVAWRPRLGVGLHYARWRVGLSREENGAGLGPIYQFMLSSVIK
jgi:hypothetical protein